MMGIMRFLGEVKQEMKNTTWPSAEALRKDTTTIFSVIIFFSIFFYAADRLIDFLLNLV